jgi:transcriptional regulator with XRE-family HTH domain
MQTATREVVVNREELGRIAGERRRELGWTITRVSCALGVAHETIRAFEDGRGHLGIDRVRRLLEYLGIPETNVATRPAISGQRFGQRARREGVVANDRLIQRLIAYALVVNGGLSVVAIAGVAEVDEERVRRLVRHEWFRESSAVIQLTPAGRQAIG